MIEKLVARLETLKALVSAKPANLMPASMSRKELPPELYFTQTELVRGAFKRSSPKFLPRKTRVAILVVCRIYKGIDSYGVIAEKAGVLVKRVREKHNLVPSSAPKAEIVDLFDEPESESDMERLERLANEAMHRDLLKQCEKLQPMCWGLACELDRRDACPMLPRGFKSLDNEELEKLRERLAHTVTIWTADLETRKRLEREAAEKRAAELAELQRLYEACRTEVKNLLAFAASKRVKLEYIELPSPSKATKQELETALAKIKGYRPKVEMRARELDPRRAGYRTHNPSPLRSPLAA
ncbi:hypothetical protein IT407_01085 [Candidatus Uhrbacteria bacterium]|nr:hypothetical protein [Candidatus Uhrbacteria bacterium]